jgi:hypothetical protein
MSVTIGAGGCGENTKESGKIEKVMADKISENLRAKQRSKQHSKGRPVEPETDKKEMNRENQREVKVMSYNICTSQYRGWYVYVKTL